MGMLTFAAGATGGLILGQRYVAPWIARKSNNNQLVTGAGLLAASFLVKRYIKGRGMKNVGTGMAGALAALGGQLVYNNLKGRM